jgi:hypothetical protein
MFSKHLINYMKHGSLTTISENVNLNLRRVGIHGFVSCLRWCSVAFPLSFLRNLRQMCRHVSFFQRSQLKRRIFGDIGSILPIKVHENTIWTCFLHDVTQCFPWMCLSLVSIELMLLCSHSLKKNVAFNCEPCWLSTYIWWAFPWSLTYHKSFIH